MSYDTVAAVTADESTRWTAWVARGVKQDRKAHRYMVAIVASVAVALAASLAIALAARYPLGISAAF